MIVRVNALDPVSMTERLDGQQPGRKVKRYVRAVLQLRALEQAVQAMKAERNEALNKLTGGELAHATKIVDRTISFARADAERRTLVSHGNGYAPVGVLQP